MYQAFNKLEDHCLLTLWQVLVKLGPKKLEDTICQANIV